MTTLTDKINNFIENDDLQSIESAFNSGCHPIREPRIDLWTGKFLGYETIWVDTREVNKEYYDNLSSDCQSYIQQLDEYKSLSYDDVIIAYDKKVDKYLLSIGKHDSQIYELDSTGKIIGFKKSYCL